MAYAQKTKVDVDTTRYEIERTLKRYGAGSFGYGMDEQRGMAAIMFSSHDRKIRFVIKLPDPNDRRFRKASAGATRTAVAQAERAIWRALLLCVKAKLEAVESKIETFEEAFLAHVVLPDGKTASEWLSPQIKLAYESGSMPKQILALPNPDEAE